MKNYPATSLPITAWAEDDRPREKLQYKGRQALSDAELLAILIGSGSRHESAVALSKRILQSAGNNLNELGKKSIEALMEFKGIGEAKAITIAAAMELGRRRRAADMLKRPVIQSSFDAYQYLAPSLLDLRHEEFWVLFMDRGNKVIDKAQVSIGGMDATIADGKIIFRKAIEKQAASIVLSHNHPSGTLRPSQADIDLTMKLKRAALLLDMRVMDHLIVADGGYFSFMDEGMMEEKEE